MTMAVLAEAIGVSWQTIQQWEAGRAAPKRTRLEAAAKALHTTPDYLLFGTRASSPANARAHVEATMQDKDVALRGVGYIAYWNAPGSCGGGSMTHEPMEAGRMVKEESFFDRYGVRPKNAIAVYADGDSMSNFIVDGDIVIFDTSKTELRSGKIFLVEHPDGMRIKQVHRNVDGSWVLQSLHPDKQRFPDERITEDQGFHLKVHGQFVYRQGG